MHINDLSRYFGTSYAKGNPNLHVLLNDQSHLVAVGSSLSGLVLLMAVSRSMLVKEILGHARFGGSYLAHPGDTVTQFFGGFHLLVQVIHLNAVMQVRVMFC